MQNDIHLRFPTSSVSSAPVKVNGSFDHNKFRRWLENVALFLMVEVY